MLTADELQDARDDLHAELLDRCVIVYQDGTSYDPGTFVEVPNWEVRQQDVPCLVVPDPDRTSSPNEAGEPIIMRTYSVTVPHDTVVQPEDVVVPVSTFDGQLDGLQLTVRDVRTNSLAISRRVRCVARLTPDPTLAAYVSS
jgi:hypothetical protein